MQKVLIILITILSLIIISGCDKKKVNYPTNEIETYERIDESKIQIRLSYIGNLGFTLYTFNEQFEKLYPDYQIIMQDISGGTSKTEIPYIEWLENDCKPDVMLIGGAFSKYVDQEKYFIDLSNNHFINNYQNAVLNTLAVNGRIYSLPGPSDVDCIMYNKTMFEKYGWSVPNTLDEFIALCDQITTDTKGAVEPFNPNAKYSNEYEKLMQAIYYEELFGGVVNRTWYNDYLNLNANYSSHMAPIYEGMEKLIKHNIVKLEHYTYSATSRWNEFLAGEIAMVNGAMKSDYESSIYDFGFMPYPSSTSDLGYLISSISSNLAVTNKKRSTPQMDGILKYVNYFSSVEGQQLLIQNTLKISNVKGVVAKTTPALSSLKKAIDEGHLFTSLEFKKEGYKSSISFWTDTFNLLEQTKTVEEILINRDELGLVKIDSSTTNSPVIIGQATDDFTILETSNFIADMYKKITNADIALITNNVAYRGNLMKIFKGDLYPDNMLNLLPRSLENKSQLVKITMTGKQIKDALNNPRDDNGISNCIYAFAGLKCKVAPWNNLGSKYLSINLTNGEELKDNKMYTVACWEGTIYDEYITSVSEKYDGTFVQLITKYISDQETIKPAKDGRITLVWE